MKKTSFAVSVVALSSLAVLAPSMVFAQDESGRPEPDFVQNQQGSGPHEGSAYDTKTEVTFKGIVAHVKTGRSALYWLFRIKTLGLVKIREQEKQLLLKTDRGMVHIQLGPAAFLTDKKLEIRKGDSLEVTGSRVTTGKSQVVLAREIRKGDSAWTLRDARGQPLWSASQTRGRGWAKKKVILAVVIIKAAVTAAVLLAK